MPNIGSVMIAIKAVDEASSIMDKIRTSTSLLGSTFQKMGGAVGAVGDIMQGFAAGGVAGAAIGALGAITEGLQWSIREAGASEQAFKNLADAVKRSGTIWTDVETRTRSYLSQLQKTTVYSDEALAGMVERLLTFGMTYEQAMSAAGTALDLAAAKHMDLQSAADVLGKAFMGNTALLKRYGIDIEDVGGKSATFTDIMAALNEQFGGAAQDQAKTYAGIQERLKNATSELGEKIGGMVLPALAGMTEAMIPVVDWLGQGINAVQAWLTEVAKMPEVQGVIAVVNEAFQGLGIYLSDLWAFMQESFGPALQELWSAFKELWAALSPIGEALSELLSVFGDTGNIDLFKLLIQGIVLEIRGIAEIIKTVAPYIRMFADAFKGAADFITPVLKGIHDAIVGFLDALRGAFQGFYAWLVGGSLWSDLWDAVISKTTAAIGQLLSDLANKFLEPMKNAFARMIQAVGDLWSKGWQTIQTTFTTISEQLKGGITSFLESAKSNISMGLDSIKSNWETSWNAVHTTFVRISQQVSAALNAKLEEMKTALSTSTSQYAPLAGQALTAMQSTINAVMAVIRGDWQGALTGIQNALSQWGQVIQGIMSGIMTTLLGIVSQGVAAMIAAFNNLIVSAQSAVAQAQALFSQAQQTAASAAQQLAQAAKPATDAITNAFNQAYNTVANGAQWLWNTLTGHSIWTDMLADMQGQTEASLAEIRSSFQGAFENVALSVPAAPGGSRAGLAEPVSVSLGSQSITIPITVTLDGQVISRQVEQRIVERVSLRGKKVA